MPRSSSPASSGCLTPAAASVFLAGAFQNALPSSQPALRKAAVQRLADEIAQMDAAYGAPLARRYLAVDEVQVPSAERLPLTALAEWAQAAVTRAEA